jgi:hypothetical protein
MISENAKQSKIKEAQCDSAGGERGLRGEQHEAL